MFEGDPAIAGQKKKGRGPAARGKGGRKPKSVAPPVPQTPVPTRKRSRKPRPVMIGMDVMPHLAGLNQIEMSALMAIVGAMKDVPKKSRAKIVAALAKVFA
jgi:hypothetical protein